MPETHTPSNPDATIDAEQNTPVAEHHHAVVHATHPILHHIAEHSAEHIQHAISHGIPHGMERRFVSHYVSRPPLWLFYALDFSLTLNAHSGEAGAARHAAIEVTANGIAWNLIGKLPLQVSIPILCTYTIGHLGHNHIERLENIARQRPPPHEITPRLSFTTVDSVLASSPYSAEISTGILYHFGKISDGIDKGIAWLQKGLDSGLDICFAAPKYLPQHNDLISPLPASELQLLPIFDIRNNNQLQVQPVYQWQLSMLMPITNEPVSINLLGNTIPNSNTLPIISLNTDLTCFMPEGTNHAALAIPFSASKPPTVTATQAFELPSPQMPNSIASQMNGFMQGLHITGGSSGIALGCTLSGPAGWITAGAILGTTLLANELVKRHEANKQTYHCRKLLSSTKHLVAILQPIDNTVEHIINQYNANLDISDPQTRRDQQQAIIRNIRNLLDHIEYKLSPHHGIDKYEQKAKKHNGDLTAFQTARSHANYLIEQLNDINAKLNITSTDFATLSALVEQPAGQPYYDLIVKEFIERCMEKVIENDHLLSSSTDAQQTELVQSSLKLCHMGLLKSPLDKGLLQYRGYLLIQNNPQQAQTDFEVLLQQDKNDIYAKNGLMLVKLNQGDQCGAQKIYADLKQSLNAAKTLDNDREIINEEYLTQIAAEIHQSVFNNAMDLVAQGETQAALTLVNNPLYEMPDLQKSLAMSYGHIKDNRPDQAIHLLSTFEATPEQPLVSRLMTDAWQIKAAQFADDKRYTEAMTALERAEQFSPNSSRIARSMGVLAQQSGDTTAAEAFFKTAIARTETALAQAQDPLDKCLLINDLASIHHAAGDLTTAVSCYENSLTVLNERLADPDISSDNKLEVTQQVEQITEVIEILSLSQTVNNALEAKDYDRALADLHSLKEIDPSNKSTVANIATVYLKQGDFSEASKILTLELQDDPHNAQLLEAQTELNNQQLSYWGGVATGLISIAAGLTSLYFLLGSNDKKPVELHESSESVESLPQAPAYCPMPVLPGGQSNLNRTDFFRKKPSANSAQNAMRTNSTTNISVADSFMPYCT